MARLADLRERLGRGQQRKQFEHMDVEFVNDCLSIYLYNGRGKGGSEEIHIVGKEDALWLKGLLTKKQSGS